VLTLLSLTARAHAERVYTLRSYWDDGHTTIYSDIVVEHDDGTMESQQAFGGIADGIGMIQFALYSGGQAQVDYVPTTSDGGVRLRWPGSCVFLTPDSGGTAAIPMDAEIQAIGASAAAWNTQPASCSYLRLLVDDAAPMEVGQDGKNIIKFRDTRWCRPATGGKPEKCYSASATAITTVMFIADASQGQVGTIIDTDVEVNGVNFSMATGCETNCMTAGTRGQIEDLQNTLTHEFGHVIGLAHTCWDGKVADTPRDSDGNLAPLCGTALPSSVTEATMYPTQQPGETKKRILENDDINGACGTYPLASDPMVCAPAQLPSSSGCSVAGGGGRPLVFVLALLGALRIIVPAGRRLRARACSRSRRP
jgi:hypothetical protein